MNLTELQQFFILWDRIATINLVQDEADAARWAWEPDGCYSSRSSYAMIFVGREVAPYAEFSWKSRAPLSCRFFACLALRDRCWTSDRLARRQLPSQPACPFCAQEPEAIAHVLLTCVAARQVWFSVLSAWGKLEWMSTTNDKLVEWCSFRTHARTHQKDVHSLLTLVLWELWKHRNAIVFDCVHPSVSSVLRKIEQEGRAWSAAGLFKGDQTGFLQALSRSLSE
jgi:hypothetical protein